MSEPVVFTVMVGTLLLLQFYSRQPIGLALLGGALVGAIVGGNGIPIRHLVEGSFTYLDPILIIFTAMLFMRILQENGSLEQIAYGIIRGFGRIPIILTVIITFFIMFPAMLTGITTTSVLTTGALMAPSLIALGMSKERVAVLIGVISVMGMLAPPINLLVMIIGQGVDMPYIGFEKPLLAVTLPVALIASFILAFPVLRKADLNSAIDTLPESSRRFRFVSILPLIFVFGVMAAIRLFPEQIPDFGIPLTFAVGSLLALMLGKKVALSGASYRALLASLPVLGLLVGVGAFLQIMTLTGVRGMLVVSVLALPLTVKYLALAISLPLFGGVSAFASAMVFGVPFLLSLLGTNEIALCAGIAILAGLGDLLPPSAINARFSAQVSGNAKLGKVIVNSLPFVLLAAIGGLILISVN